jgi:hypothetical protein
VEKHIGPILGEGSNCNSQSEQGYEECFLNFGFQAINSLITFPPI